ncbi:MAG TPA: hypothetical protein VLI55_00430 [Bryobacteraceae bacterium]|nr:hypothetical protein [Bryobacteraceae bacterium]
MKSEVDDARTVETGRRLSVHPSYNPAVLRREEIATHAAISVSHLYS